MPVPALSPRQTFLPVALLVTAMVSVQSGASLAKSLFPTVGAQGATALRVVLAAIMLALILRPWRMRLNHRSLLDAALYGISLGGMNFLFYMAIRTVPLGIGVALEFTGPLAVALLGSRRRVDFLWVALAVVGLYLLIPLNTPGQLLDPVGALYALGAGVCWAAYILFGQRAGQAHGVQMASLGVLIAAVSIAPIGIAHAGVDLLQPALLPTALAVAVLSTALPYSLEMLALAQLPARTFGTLMSLEPAVAALAGFLFLSEHLAFVQWLAIGSIIVASAGATLTQGPANVQPLPAD